MKLPKLCCSIGINKETPGGSKMTFIEEKIRVTLENLQNLIVTERVRITDISFFRCGYKNANTPPKDAAWQTFSNGEPIKFEKDSHAWFHFRVNVAESRPSERTYLKFTTGKEGEWDAMNPQCTVFVNGDTCVQAFDTNHTELLLESGEKDIYVYFYAGMADCTLFPTASLITKNADVERLYYDIKVPFEAMKCLDKNSCEYAAVCDALDKTTLCLDFRGLMCEDFLKSVEEAGEYIRNEFYGKLCGKDAYGEISLIGHTHIDVAWKWTLAQTVEKSQRSFSTVINLMRQYPDYIFMSSQPQLYEYVKQTDPGLYEKIRAAIADGRWESEGAMWLEADTNLISGESLIRQILYGKKFMRDEFGAESKILWLPDVFGYSAALPQILKKCGVDKFFTAKISWSETNKFPHDNFIWQGIDGSEVFAVLSDSYVKRLEPGMIKDSLKKHTDKKYSSTHIATFGFGDGGGGPTAEMLENFERLKTGLPGFPKVTMKKAADTLRQIKEQFDKNSEELRYTPKWSGELYLEMHRGTYTTMAANKKYNRQCEFLYQKAESACVGAKILAGFNVPKKQLDEGWVTILRNQFHDIIPGSSIEEVYKDSAAEYEKTITEGEKIFTDAVSAISENIGTDGGILVYNPTPFTSGGIVTVDGKEIYADNIPAHGYAVISPDNHNNSQQQSVKADSHSIENDRLKVVFDDKMHIVSLYDKVSGRETIASGMSANVLEVFEDYPRSYDAWEITEYYKQKKWIADNVSEVVPVNTPLYSGIRITRKYRNSEIRQFIRLYPGSARLDFITEIDWFEDHVLLKAAFPFDIHTSSAKYEIQFGHVERPTHRNTSWDQAKFEVCAHKWADLSEADYGVALLNDCKYGYSCEENILKLSLLKAPTYPNPTADRGHHSFTYSVYPYAGALSQSDTVKQAYLLNNPFYAVKVMKNSGGTLPERFCPVHSDTPSAVIDTVKPAEDGNGIIIRMYDSANRKSRPVLDFGFPAAKAYLCDMLENNLNELELDGEKLSVSLSNFEVKTIRVIPS